MALNALTALYSDSDEEFNDEDENGAEGELLAVPTVRSVQPSPTAAPVEPQMKTPTKLVAYHTSLSEEKDKEEAGHITEEEEEMELVQEEREEVERREPGKDKRKPNPQGARGAALPPEPAGRCPRELEETFRSLFEKKRRGVDPNAAILQRKDFRNPSLYEKLIQYCQLEEFGTNFPPHLYNPHLWGPESYYDELAKAQKVEMDRREKERRTKVDIVSGTVKKAPQPTLVAEQPRRSKWDQVGPVGLALPPPPKVIPAFGVMKKK